MMVSLTMSKDLQEDKLLKELEDYRWFVLANLADLSEEKGDLTSSKGYRYLADHKKWPGALKGYRYQWYFVYPWINDWSNPVDPVDIHIDESDTLNRGIMKYATIHTSKFLPKLIKKTAFAIGKWLEALEAKEDAHEVPL